MRLVYRDKADEFHIESIERAETRGKYLILRLSTKIGCMLKYDNEDEARADLLRLAEQGWLNIGDKQYSIV